MFCRQLRFLASFQCDAYRIMGLSMLGVCGDAPDELARLRQQTCLTKRHNLRTSPVWDLAYGLGL